MATLSSLLGVSFSGNQGAQGLSGGGQGAQGLQGTSIQGPAGSTQGLQGAQGTQGTQGLQGVQGLGNQGAQGTQGLQGTQGTQGLSNQGAQGTQGLQGTQGTQGLSNQGVQGTQGLQGTQGPQGLSNQGAQGIQGLQGTQGTQGLSNQGAQGIQGLQGTQGTQGLQAAQGPQGLQGIQGSQGVQATQGSQGLQGIQGLQGLSNQGVQGPTGSGGGSSVNITDDTANATRYVGFTTATTGVATQIGVASTQLVFNPSTGNLGIGTTNPQYKLHVVGSFGATTKSIVPHPTQSNKRLQYGSLESPYHGIRLTGKGTITNGQAIINLPEYISSFVKEDGINIQLTNIRHNQVLWVEQIDIENNRFVIGTDSNVENYEFYWDFTAIRKDVVDLEVEF